MLVEFGIEKQPRTIMTSLALALFLPVVVWWTFGIPHESIGWAFAGWGVYFCLSNLSFFVFPKKFAMQIISTGYRAKIYAMLEESGRLEEKSLQTMPPSVASLPQPLAPSLMPAEWLFSNLFYGYYLLYWIHYPSNTEITIILCLLLGTFTAVALSGLKDSMSYPDNGEWSTILLFASVAGLFFVLFGEKTGIATGIAGMGSLVLFVWFFFNLYKINKERKRFDNVSKIIVADIDIQNTSINDLFAIIVMNGGFNSFAGGLALRQALKEAKLWEQVCDK